MIDDAYDPDVVGEYLDKQTEGPTLDHKQLLALRQRFQRPRQHPLLTRTQLEKLKGWDAFIEELGQ